LINSFTHATIPHIIFGPGRLEELYELILKYGKNIILVIGGNSLKASGKWNDIIKRLEDEKIKHHSVKVDSEPSPSLIDENARKYRNEKVDLIIGIGGGSVMDTGKALSAMITKEDSIVNYLEGVGTKEHDGKKVPYIAIPTTSGTGSEATKNAVISQVGPQGFKRSLRHDNFVPNIAIIDPTLMLSCPSIITAACGLDAFTQLLESYVSSKSNPISDALAYSGMSAVKDALVPVSTSSASDLAKRVAMAYGSLISGITLANAGLGLIHGLASSIGGFFNIPHGVICGTLLSEVIKANINALKKLGLQGIDGLKKHAKIGALLSGNECLKNEEIDKYCDYLIQVLEDWTARLKIETLGAYGISKSDLDKIIEYTSLKNNPVKLVPEEIKQILLNCL
jgi:alcohol dehydrogenase class IV